MAKLVRAHHRFPGMLLHWCPACDEYHEIETETPNRQGAVWKWNGDARRPTFSPSVNLRINTPDMGEHYQPDIASTVCHYFIRDGRIQYLGDCTHAMKGTTVDLPDFPDHAALGRERL